MNRTDQLPAGSRWGIGARLTLMTFVLVGFVLSALVAGIGYSTSRLLEERAIAHVSDDARAVVNMIRMFNQAVTSSVRRFSTMFASSFGGGFAEESFRSLLLEAVGSQIAAGDGLGIARHVQSQIAAYQAAAGE